MTIYNNKVILLIGGQTLMDAAFVQRFLDGGAKEVRVLGSSETAVQTLREALLPETCSINLETKKRMRFYVGDLSDNAYMEEAVTGADFVLFIPAVPRPFDCEVAPAVTTVNFLDTVTGVLHVATDCGVQKTVVVSPARQEPLLAMPDMLAALMETVVIAEGRYLGNDSKTTIICARQDGDLSELADFAFANGANADLLIQSKEIIKSISCENFDFKRGV